MQKKKFSNELCYLIGLVLIACNVALATKANIGVSVVVAPAYLVYLKLSSLLPWLTFGRAGYIFQALLLLIMVVIVRKFRLNFLFSFVTAVISGKLLDLLLSLMAFDATEMWQRLLLFILSMIMGATGVSFMFHTYISPEIYELFVMEVSAKAKIPQTKFKIIYDYSSCVLAIVMSFLFFGFGHFEGIKAGSIINALVNGWVIKWISARLAERFEFVDTCPRLVALFRSVNEKDNDSGVKSDENA